MRLYASILLGALLALTGVLFGLWWAPFVVGLAVPFVARRGRLAVPIGAGIGLVSWLVPLAVGQVRYGLDDFATSQSLAAIMGFGHAGAVPVVLTLLVGTLLGLTGAWLATAAWAVVAGNARVDAARNE